MNLVILYPDFFFRTTLDTSEAYESTAHPARNLITGARQYFYSSDAEYATQVNFITGVSNLAAEERAMQYVYVGGLNLIAANVGNSAIVVDGAADNTFSTSVYNFSESNIYPEDLYGRAGEDYVVEAPVENERDYWRVYLTTSGAGTVLIQARTLYAGRWFYWGVEPEAPVNEYYRQSGGRRDKRTLQIIWKGVSDDALHEFSEKILRHKEYNHVVLYTREWHTILDGERVFPAYITSFSVDRLKTDRNVVTVEFTECI
jgi:hypothetical protein